MRKVTFSAVVLCLVMMLVPGELLARGFRGGGGGRRGGGGGGSRGRVSRPAPRSSAPNMNARRSAPRSRNVSRPSRPNVSRPSSRPATSNRPQYQRPSGGFKPSARPSRPQTRPSIPTTRPNNRLPHTGSGSGGRLPNRPTTRPSVPNLGGGTGHRPNVNPPNRPGKPGNGRRPNAGAVGDFLGMDKPLRPGNGIGNRPDIGNGNGIGNRPSIGSGNVGINRPVNISKINVGRNTVINNRPSWANIDRGRVTNINNRWQGQIGGMHNWRHTHPHRAAYWAGWGSGVRSSYRYHYRNPGCFRGSWWTGHPYRWGGWHYGYSFHNRPWRHWWTIPTYRACVNWFAWTAPSTVWAEPVYYDYGQDGNVVYNDNSVYINGDQVATTTEFAQSAAELATVEAPANEQEAEQAEWMPLGTFAVSAGEKDVEPTRIVQLAVNKQGVISGTLFNTQTEVNQSVQGQVDKQTQRVAMRIGESKDLVVETGLYNLTQDEAPLLVHFGTEKVENWLLVRLEDPAPDDADESQEQ